MKKKMFPVSFVLDVAAVIASLDSKRNCIQLVPTEKRASAAHRELNKRQLKLDEEKRQLKLDEENRSLFYPFYQVDLECLAALIYLFSP